MACLLDGSVLSAWLVRVGQRTVQLTYHAPLITSRRSKSGNRSVERDRGANPLPVCHTTPAIDEPDLRAIEHLEQAIAATASRQDVSFATRLLGEIVVFYKLRGQACTLRLVVDVEER